METYKLKYNNYMINKLIIKLYNLINTNINFKHKHIQFKH